MTFMQCLNLVVSEDCTFARVPHLQRYIFKCLFEVYKYTSKFLYIYIYILQKKKLHIYTIYVLQVMLTYFA